MQGESPTTASTPTRAVFLSYASQDAEAAQRICAALRAGDIEVWFDQSELRGGEVWDQRIRREIHDCALFIPIVSQHTQERLEGYFRREWKLAVERTHDMAEQKPFLLPVVVDGTGDKDAVVPELFRAVHWTRLPAGETPASFVERVQHLLSPDSSAQIRAPTIVGSFGTVRAPVQRARMPKPGLLLVTTIVVALGAAGYFLINKLWISRPAAPSPTASASAAPAVFGPPPHSIAVLPFENLSDDKSNAYFAAGIQEEILSRLAGVGDLKVISRTSTEKYKSRPDNLRTVASELGVASVIEGSVQKSGDKVRINVQLIDAGRDLQLWANIYDRDLKDIFVVESEVSQSIVDALKAKLSPRETRAIAVLPTRNSKAYDLFLKGEYEFAQAVNAQDIAAPYDRADEYYRKSLELDPEFAQAYARLAVARMHRHWFIKALTPDELNEVQTAARHALELRPDQPDAHEALGLYHYWGHRDYERALVEFDEVLTLQPSNALVHQWRAAVYRRKGDWTRSLEEFQRSVELAPRDAIIAGEYGTTLVLMRRFADADGILTHALALDPTVMQAIRFLATNAVNGYGDVARARRVLDAAPPGLLPQPAHMAVDVSLIDQRVYLDVLERRFAQALDTWRKIPAAGDGRVRQLFGQITVRIIAGQRAQAQADCRELNQLLAHEQVQAIDEPMAAIEQSWVEVCLGRTDAAIHLARRATELLPLSRDAYYGAYYLTGLAQIDVQTGRFDEAIGLIKELLSVPAGGAVSVERLKLDPVWDPLRNDPRFPDLISGGDVRRKPS
jgi:TolB-like protein/Tfp pilus assembly protein PilF